MNGKNAKKDAHKTGKTQERAQPTDHRGGQDQRKDAGVTPREEEDVTRRVQETDRETELTAQLKQTEEKLVEANDQLLRKAAEFENSRKRILREKEESIRYANAALLSDILPIIDDFERAIQSASDSEDFDAFHSGVSIIEKQLLSLLERNWGLKRFTAEGQVFDPQMHEAIAVQETREHDASVVLENFQKGYLLHDRVLRPAKVKVAKPVSSNEEVSGEDAMLRKGEDAMLRKGEDAMLAEDGMLRNRKGEDEFTNDSSGNKE